MNLTESGISALLDAHDALVKAYIGSNLGFDEFVFLTVDFREVTGSSGMQGRARIGWYCVFSGSASRSTCECRVYCRGCSRPMIRRTCRTTMPIVFCRRSEHQRRPNGAYRAVQSRAILMRSDQTSPQVSDTSCGSTVPDGPRMATVTEASWSVGLGFT